MGKIPKLSVAIDKTKQCAKEKGVVYCDDCTEDYEKGGACTLLLDVCHELAKNIERHLRAIHAAYTISQCWDDDKGGSETTVEKLVESLEDDLSYYQSEGKQSRRPAALFDIDRYRRRR